jgi:hypothetical protein
VGIVISVTRVNVDDVIIATMGISPLDYVVRVDDGHR